jgi:transcriptional regulator with GAF, ATPase, and Fis domain
MHNPINKDTFLQDITRVMTSAKNKEELVHVFRQQFDELYESMCWQEKEKAFLLSFSTDVARVRGRADLMEAINTRLKSLLYCTHCGIGIIELGTDNVNLFLVDPDSRAAKDDEFIASFKKFSFKNNEDNVIKTALRSDVPLIFDLEAEDIANRLPVFIKKNLLLGIKEMLCVTLNIGESHIGLFCLFSDVKGYFDARALDIVQGVGSQISIAVANILANEQMIESENGKSFLLSVSNDITSCRNKNEFLDIVHKKLGKLFTYKEIVISFLDDDKKTHSEYLHNLSDETKSHQDYEKRSSDKYPIADGIYERVLLSQVPLIMDMDELMKQKTVPPYVTFFYENGAREMIAIALREKNDVIGAMFIWLPEKNSFNNFQLNMALGVCSQISIGVANIRAYEKIQNQLTEINRYKLRLEEEKRYLQQQIETVYNNGQIVGANEGLKEVLYMVSKVAVTDSTVLILGETGTGKELIAREIHNSSPRREKLMIKVNCAALPASLIESELFGHEKGSFTGATERRLGKFELANKGTLFLDEIGELPLELQVKLLRVIQEKEIERVGGKEVIKVDVRIVAATNRDLEKEVDQGQFRSDLYYRLNVFPIMIPALRERSNDIIMLAGHFADKFSRKFGKKITHIDNQVIQGMINYHWPGNVRELEHVMERSVLMSSTETLKDIFLPKTSVQLSPSVSSISEIKSLADSERDYIIAVLKQTGGRIKGQGGAADILGIPATTLNSRMKKMGIKKV